MYIEYNTTPMEGIEKKLPYRTIPYRTRPYQTISDHTIPYQTRLRIGFGFCPGIGIRYTSSAEYSHIQNTLIIIRTEKTAMDQYAQCLIISEYALKRKYRTQYATIITDSTGKILWVADERSKQVIYDFIDNVGMEWMENVESVLCDENTEIADAFPEKCPWIQLLFIPTSPENFK